MRLIIDTVFRKIYSMVVKSRPDIKEEIGDVDNPKHLDLTLDMFPCYRSILNKISETCFSLPKVRIVNYYISFQCKYIF